MGLFFGDFFFIFFGLVMGVACVVCQRRSFLGVLLSLEIFTLILFSLFFVVWGGMCEVLGLSLIFLCMSVCVVSVSLGLVVKLVRSSGGDYVSGLCL
uniref:NADH-ubiquinone oxidoreductase chain 4L n=1 Tax=Margaritifera margaritifera TaxID=2505931 RepID=A0A4Y5QSV3_9BIVA|nr:NADH dehydrogenase subunit 4L [Margaritifera margaritifera]